jgi:hypothetical protein
MDRRLIWAPIVQQPQGGREGVPTGNLPNGFIAMSFCSCAGGQIANLLGSGVREKDSDHRVPHQTCFWLSFLNIAGDDGSGWRNPYQASGVLKLHPLPTLNGLCGRSPEGELCLGPHDADKHEHKRTSSQRAMCFRRPPPPCCASDVLTFNSITIENTPQGNIALMSNGCRVGIPDKCFSRTPPPAASSPLVSRAFTRRPLGCGRPLAERYSCRARKDCRFLPVLFDKG